MEKARELLAAKRHFYEHYHFSTKLLKREYLGEMYLYNNDHWSAPQRAARISAIVKRYKTSQMIAYVFKIAFEMQLDLTPLTVKRLCKALFNRTGSQDIIVNIFGQKDRCNKSNFSSQAAVDQIVALYSLAARSYWQETLSDIARTKDEYKSQIQAQKQKNNL